MATLIQRRKLLVVALLGSVVTFSTESATAQYMPRFGAAFKALIGKTGEKKVVEKKNDIPAPKLTEKNYAQVQLAIGDSLAKEGNFEGAKTAYEAALRNDQSLAGAYHHLARLHEKSGHGDDSKKLFQQALKLDPNNAEIVCDYGYYCYLRQDWKESQRQFQHALQLDPCLKRAHNNLGLVYARNQRPDDALQQFTLAGLSPADARANLGFVYLTERRVPEAKIELQRAIATSPSSAKAKTVLASLEKSETAAQPNNVASTTGPLPAAEVPSAPQVARLPATAADSTPHESIARVGAPRQNKVLAPVAAPTPHVPVASVGAAGPSKVVVPAAETPRYVALASKQVDAPSVAQQTNATALPTQHFSPVLSDYPLWDNVSTPASAVGFTQKAERPRVMKPIVVPPAPPAPTSKTTVRFVPSTTR